MENNLSSPDTLVENIDLSKVGRYITDFEIDLHAEKQTKPYADYSNVLKKLREESKSISTFREEIEFAQRFKYLITQISSRYGLSDSHFLINTEGDPIIVKENGGEHLISPTHFENGAYFSHPHADHQLNWTADQLPRISIGKYVRFGRNCAINAGGDVIIGDHVWLSPGCQFIRQDHDAYGRPSIASRTVAMTKLPAITVQQYAWIGREAVVGWNADYLGKASIIASRAFIHNWIGDYCIAGDRGKILQYLPYKAYLVEIKKTNFIDMLKIKDWSAVEDEWQKIYTARMQEHLKNKNIPDNIIHGNDALVISPSNPYFINALNVKSIDVISSHNEICADILQLCVDNKKYNLRYRGDFNPSSLPFPDSARKHYNRKVGYETVLSFDNSNNPALMKEIYRVTKVNGTIIIPQEELDLFLTELSSTGQDNSISVESNLDINNKRMVFLKKKI